MKRDASFFFAFQPPLTKIRAYKQTTKVAVVDFVSFEGFSCSNKFKKLCYFFFIGKHEALRLKKGNAMSNFS